MQKLISIVFLVIGVLLSTSCKEYTPKPRGYLRIDLPTPDYSVLPLKEYPYSFNISSLATIELPPTKEYQYWVNIFYPSLHAKIYCSYFTIKPSTLDVAMEESRELVLRQAKQIQSIEEKTFENSVESVYAKLFLLDGESASPIQFTITDSTNNFFRGALYYETKMNVDSIAPVMKYIEADIEELIQSFSWN